MTSIKVHYFGGYGRAEATRMLLAHAQIPFENVDYTFESLPAAKASGNLEFGQLPVLEIDGKFFSQSVAMLRMLGLKYGYYPEDAYEAWRVDSFIDSVGDLINQYYKAAFNPNEEEKKELFAKYYETIFPTWLGIIEKRLQSNSSQKFLVGDKMTIADFQFAAIGFSNFYNEANATAGEV